MLKIPGIYRPPGLEETSVGQPPADLFALGCVFLEMSTVLCGRKVRDFEAYRADSEGDIAYRNTLPKALEWLSQLNMNGFEGKDRLLGIIREMTDPDAKRRPTALKVAQTLQQCKNRNGTLFIGECAA
ncbi:hypothetical protein MMC17_005066 [Xylographa soralifera]|nr:hypothetical protein [Xylographa soralifera]